MQRATPGMESILGLITQSASVRNSMGERLVERRPIFSRSIVAEVMGDMTGVLTPAGNSPAISPSRSLSMLRAMKISVPSWNTAMMVDKPAMDSERNAAMFPKPLMVFSRGRVTSTSTCSGESPGASVSTSTSGGTKLGSTSSLAWAAV